MDFFPIARIVLRYLIGGALIGSAEFGDRLAADPDLVFYAALGIGLMVEFAYGLAKRRGWAT
jgi:hypothetical protein